MTILYIPTIGDALRLNANWTFDIHDEYRNSDFIREVLGAPARWEDYNEWTKKMFIDDKAQVTLPRGSVLKVDRLYIRKGQGDYDSITFWLTDCPNKAWAPKKAGGTAKGKLRFWVKLQDANGMVFE